MKEREEKKQFLKPELEKNKILPSANKPRDNLCHFSNCAEKKCKRLRNEGNI
ncbi:MAG: hypothetical protein AAB596_01710 [Patescibacteria group bacterium]